MISKEFKEAAVYAVVTMFLTVGLFSARAAISNDLQTSISSKAPIQGMDTHTTVQPGKQPGTVIVKVSITNPKAAIRPVDLNLNLVRVDFTGNPLSRVPTDSDQTSTLERSHRVQGKIKGHSTANFQWTWKVDAKQPAKLEFGNVPTYLVNWEGKLPTDGKANTVTLTSFPASIVWSDGPAKR